MNLDNAKEALAAAEADLSRLETAEHEQRGRVADLTSKLNALDTEIRSLATKRALGRTTDDPRARDDERDALARDLREATEVLSEMETLLETARTNVERAHERYRAAVANMAAELEPKLAKEARDARDAYLAAHSKWLQTRQAAELPATGVHAVDPDEHRTALERHALSANMTTTLAASESDLRSWR